MKTLVFGNEDRVWVRPSSWEEVLEIKGKLGEGVKIVGGSSEVRFFSFSFVIGDR